jgi:hypothetical protein
MQNLELWHKRIFSLNKASLGSWIVCIKSLVEFGKKKFLHYWENKNFGFIKLTLALIVIFSTLGFITEP